MEQLALMRSMLSLVQDQMMNRDEHPEALTIQPHDQPLPDLLADLDPESPEAIYLRYIRSLGRAELADMRREICLSALAAIDGELAAMGAQ